MLGVSMLNAVGANVGAPTRSQVLFQGRMTVEKFFFDFSLSLQSEDISYKAPSRQTVSAKLDI
jgi:hypothetical protein